MSPYPCQKLNSSFAIVVRGCVSYKMHQVVAHSSAPVDSDERFNTHSQEVPMNVPSQLVNQHFPPASHREYNTEVIHFVQSSVRTDSK